MTSPAVDTTHDLASGRELAGRSRAGRSPGGPRLGRLLRGPAGQPAWARPLLLALLGGTACLYLIGLDRSGWANDFYSAAVQAGSTSWKAFFFGSFDASSFITVDKTPASLWVMELSARIFGLNYWSLLAPQALEGVVAVGVLYATVRRWSGPAAGLLAGAALASTPVAALMFRFNNPDALLVLLMTLAAYAVTRAIDSGRTRWLVLAGTLIGVGFLTKMLQAFLVLPAFAVAYLVAGPGGLVRRSWQLLAGAGAMVVSAGWWVAIVELIPASSRPYIGGSTSNSIIQLALGYNGLGRLDGNETGSVGFGNGGRGGGSPAFSGQAGLTRLFGPDLGGQISWLLPAALISAVLLIWVSRRGVRTDRRRAAVLLWGGWLLVTGAVFSLMTGIIHPYYTVALAPAIAALAGLGAAESWRARHSWPGRAALAAMTAVSAAWAWVLLGRTPGWLPWLGPVVLITGIAATALLLAGPRLARLTGTVRGRRMIAAASVVLALVASLAGPVAYSLQTAATAHAGALPSAGPAVASAGGPGGGFPGGGSPAGRGRPGAGLGTGAPASAGPGGRGQGAARGAPGASGRIGGQSAAGPGSAGPGASGGTGGIGRAAGAGGSGGAARGAAAGPGGGIGGGLGGATQVSQALTQLLKGAIGYRWAAATVGAESAAPLQLASGRPIMAIGGFNGTDPAPSLGEFERLAAAGDIRYFIGANQDSFGGGSGVAAQISAWVTDHFRSRTVGGLTVYDLTEPRS
jgi:4-amino-4-deoxy-L-arabinose transferase-like glycosyltransferase